MSYGEIPAWKKELRRRLKDIHAREAAQMKKELFGDDATAKMKERLKQLAKNN